MDTIQGCGSGPSAFYVCHPERSEGSLPLPGTVVAIGVPRVARDDRVFVGT